MFFVATVSLLRLSSFLRPFRLFFRFSCHFFRPFFFVIHPQYFSLSSAFSVLFRHLLDTMLAAPAAPAAAAAVAPATAAFTDINLVTWRMEVVA